MKHRYPHHTTTTKDTHTVSLAARILASADVKHPEAIWGDLGDILLQNFWINDTNAVVDVHMTDVDAVSYNNMTTKNA